MFSAVLNLALHVFEVDAFRSLYRAVLVFLLGQKAVVEEFALIVELVISQKLGLQEKILVVFDPVSPNDALSTHSLRLYN
jgi:hypothetical protein